MRKITDFKQHFQIEDVLDQKNSTFFIGEEEFLVPIRGNNDDVELYTRISLDLMRKIATQLVLHERWTTNANKRYHEFLEEEDLADDFESFAIYHWDFELPDAPHNILYRYEWQEIEEWLDMDSKGYAMARY